VRFYCEVCKKDIVSDDLEYYCDCGNVLRFKEYYKPRKRVFDGKNIYHSKYREFLPFDIISMGEGGTSLIFLKEWKVFLKIESINPTGSFKDRGSSLEIGYALNKGFKSICCASTGNMGASLAAYSSFAGLNSIVFLSKNAPERKAYLIKRYGSKIFPKKFVNYQEALKYCEEYSEKNNLFLAGDYALRMEAQKTISYEIYDQLREFPDIVFLPIGNGTLFNSVHKGFEEIGKVPKIVGVVAKGCNVLYRAFVKNRESFEPIKSAKTKASAIACENPIWGRNVLNLCYKYGHEILEVSDKEMEKAAKILSNKGIFVELSSASAFSAFLKFRDKFEDKKIVIILTGSGLKE